MTDVLYYGTLAHVHSGPSQWMRRMGDQMRNFRYEVIAVLPSDEDTGQWYDEGDLDGTSFREQLDIDANDTVVSKVSKLTENKAQDLFLAAERIAAEVVDAAVKNSVSKNHL